MGEPTPTNPPPRRSRLYARELKDLIQEHGVPADVDVLVGSLDYPRLQYKGVVTHDHTRSLYQEAVERVQQHASLRQRERL